MAVFVSNTRRPMFDDNIQRQLLTNKLSKDFGLESNILKR